MIVFYLRRTMDESGHYKARKAEESVRAERGAAPEKLGLRSLLTEYPRRLLAVFSLAIGGTVAFYAYTTYSP